MLRRIDVALTPAEAQLLPPAACYAVIDALRATTTIAALFHRGLRELRVVSTLEAGRAARASPRTLLFGESGGLRPEGFDYGNSPAEAARLDPGGRDAVLVTSNGTVALCAVAASGVTVAASLVNLSAVAGFASGFDSVVAVCSGNAGARLFSLEDFAVAAELVRALSARQPAAALGDGALAALALADPASLIPRSAHAAVTRALGFEADIAFAMQRDAAPAVPAVAACGEGWAVLRDRLQRP